MGYLTLIVAFVLGGITSPALLATVLLYFIFPQRTEPTPEPNSIHDEGDDGRSIKSTAVLGDLGEKFRGEHEPNVAAGYFAVCREYVPGGVNGKPPERTTPAGVTVVAPETPSVYQSMYRSIFDRRQGPTLEPMKGNGKPTKNARNVFWVVLRHGHLMLYNDAEEVDPRHIIFLEHYDISIYGGEQAIAEGELFIKRNSIRLDRKPELESGSHTSKPFFFFSENCSDKEDFYFALLHNQEAKSDAADGPAQPQLYKVKDIISLVQKLHSSEEQMETRWVNALIGRLFLALYKTQEVEDMLRQKISKKIARVKKPAFLSGIVLRKIDLGEGAPFITNPRLKDLTVDGNCCVEANFSYSGNFRLEIGATARIDLGARFKAREVDLVLAVVCQKLDGHVLVKFKPPPSNRVWISFESMPYLDMRIEPIVSSRQITYNIILRAIESRIREVIAETIVLPHWDDSPFTDTTTQRYRGGIWAMSSNSHTPTHTDIPDEVVEDEIEISTIDLAPLPSPKTGNDRSTSLPRLSNLADHKPNARKAPTLPHRPLDGNNTAISTGIQKTPTEPPKALRTHSIASAADPLLSTDNANIDSGANGTRRNGQGDAKYSNATSSMLAISQRSPPISPSEMPADQSTLWEGSISQHRTKSSSISSGSSKPGSILERTATPINLSSTMQSAFNHSKTSTSASSHSRESTTELDLDPIRALAPTGVQARSAVPAPEKKYSTASLGAATAAAKRWGWNVLSRNTDSGNQAHQSSVSNRVGTPEHPIGRGQPLPPLGQPLPFPERKSQYGLSKRKPVPAPLPKDKPQNKQSPMLPQQTEDDTTPRDNNAPRPPVPRRRRQESIIDHDGDGEGVLVVEAPVGSEPGSPLADSDETAPEPPATDSESQNSSMTDERRATVETDPTTVTTQAGTWTPQGNESRELG